MNGEAKVVMGNHNAKFIHLLLSCLSGHKTKRVDSCVEVTYPKLVLYNDNNPNSASSVQLQF